MARRQYINPAPGKELPPGAPSDAVHNYFASKLQQAMIAKGWNQSELARRAGEHMPKGRRIARDNISTYIRGNALPGPVNLKALCEALGMKPEDLLPRRGMPSSGDRNPALDVKDTGDGNAWLRVNQAVPWDVALQVMKIIKSVAKTPPAAPTPAAPKKGKGGQQMSSSSPRIDGYDQRGLL